jgi:hydrogenase expression/formation protein HypC
MCLAVPGKLISINNQDENLLMGKVSFGGIVKEVCLDFVPEAQPGDYVLVHVGFDLNVIDEYEAQKTLDLLAEILSADESNVGIQQPATL